ncbi:MAG: ABC transporter ATP-binding protein [Deltaproteobacteria bacterium]|nr:ABC transporter ATP-binding protein [Deltaproteobacteria bacterium]MBW2047036.1 ABC transporter ATP-binding protein [Deltaproteobacteria bacterium]MBW2110060.1 ABC transporter ATP-binding protein [Deltaproteobacteria bacterium]MBW2351654.1 ABC transporter ATP-binding protein [Deltaproteobacteria bacterium]HDZ89057.1 ABC transporter ATP-binding protein [Deltaproteobacteria bacterium]
MLMLENVFKSFLHHGEIIEVLRGISLTINPGDSLSVMGASGVGKSTLLNIMGSLEPPSEGVVKFRNLDMYRMDEGRLARLRNREIGFVFQFHHLLPELNALENTMMPALIARYSRKKAAGMARKVLLKVGLERRMMHRAGELSGGEQQRVAIARALIMNPRLILGDEPTGNLDWFTGREIADLLLQLNREEGVAMVIATHNQRLAERMSKRMELIDGRIR